MNCSILLFFELTELLDSSFFPSEKVFKGKIYWPTCEPWDYEQPLDWNGVLACAKSIDSMKPCTEDVLDSSRGGGSFHDPLGKRKELVSFSIW